MNYKIVFQKAAIKFLKKQDKKTQERLLTTIKQLPQGTDIKKLKGLDPTWRSLSLESRKNQRS